MRLYTITMYSNGTPIRQVSGWFKTKKRAYEEYKKWLQKNRHSTKQYTGHFEYIDVPDDYYKNGE